ncbi:hypothetical protein J6590_024799 [Homalodisca vitripennis]|nr:hypothetical protein J6590_024799 [Homalodisca vitripennis]
MTVVQCDPISLTTQETQTLPLSILVPDHEEETIHFLSLSTHRNRLNKVIHNLLTHLKFQTRHHIHDQSAKIPNKLKNNSRKPKPLPLSLSNRILFESFVIEGDSHVRHIAGMSSQLLSRRVPVTGATPDHLIRTSAGGERNSVQRPDRRTNDLAAGEQRNIYNLEKRITSVASHNRLIVTTLPHRHDLPSTHDIYQHIALVNAYIEELVPRHHIAVLDMKKLLRKHFTRHGMHLHIRGKWQLARLIVEALGGLSASTAATEKAEVAPDTLNAVPPPPPSRTPYALPSRPQTDSPPQTRSLSLCRIRRLAMPPKIYKKTQRLKAMSRSLVVTLMF